MLVLFVNAHRPNEEGRFRFRKYYESVRKILKQTIYYGTEFQEVVLTYDNLKDYLYDQVSYRVDQNALRRFQSIEFLFIDGCPDVLPWNKSMEEVLLLINASLKSGKNMHCNGFAYFAAYFRICTKFDKLDRIASNKQSSRSKLPPNSHIENTKTGFNAKETVNEAHTFSLVKHSSEVFRRKSTNISQDVLQRGNSNLLIQNKNVKQLDYEFQSSTGDIWHRRAIVCHCGIIFCNSGQRQFSQKSSHAISKGIILPTKFDFVVFDSKNGHKILKNINFPFTFYWRSHIFCTPKLKSQAKIQVLLETEHGNPLAFITQAALCTQGLSPQMLKIIKNWLLLKTYGSIDRPFPEAMEEYKNMAIDNQVKYDNKTRLFTQSRPQSSQVKTSRIKIQERVAQKLQERKTLLGRSRMQFHGKMDELQIHNYVQRTPSRPVSAYKYREVDKSKWMTQNNFFRF